MDELAQKGQDVLRRVVLRQLSTGETPVISHLDSDGNPKYQIQNPDGTTRAATSLDEVPLDKIDPTDLAIVDQLTTDKGDKVVQQLMRSYTVASKVKGLTDIFNKDRNSLVMSRDQIRSIYDQFGDAIRAGVAEEKSSEAMMKAMEAKGFDFKTSVGFGVLLALLLQKGISAITG
jgi:hypothetical protein